MDNSEICLELSLKFVVYEFCFVISVPPPGAQAVPAHLQGQHGGQGHQHPTPAHVTPHHQPTPPHSHSQSTSHMNSQNQPNGPPTPGPVQHAPPPQHQGHPGQAHGHPPSSQTPQPHGSHLIYQQQMSQPQGHPPLQPSPHTPTSPQNIYATPMSYATTYSYAGQTGMQGLPNMTFTHTAPQSTVTHAQHQQHQHVAHQPQFVMMQNPAVHAAAAANPMQHAHHGQVPHGATVQNPHLQGKAAFSLPGQSFSSSFSMHRSAFSTLQSSCFKLNPSYISLGKLRVV